MATLEDLLGSGVDAATGSDRLLMTLLSWLVDAMAGCATGVALAATVDEKGTRRSNARNDDPRWG